MFAGTRATLGGRGASEIRGAEPVVPKSAFCFVLPAVGVTVNTQESVNPNMTVATSMLQSLGWG